MKTSKHILFAAAFIVSVTSFSQNTVIKQCLDSLIVLREVKQIYSYDNYGNNILLIHYDWNDTNKVWKESWKEENTYDSNGNQTAEIRYQWNSNAWREGRKCEYTYNSNGKKTEQANYEWSSDDWKKTEKYTYTHDSNGKKMLQICYKLVDSVWKEYSKDEYTYKGNLTKKISYILDSNNYWQATYKWEYTYDSNGNYVKGIHYEPNKKQVKTIFYDMESDFDWKETYKWEDTYDSSGNLMLTISYEGFGNNYWNLLSKLEFTHDLSYAKKDVISPYHYGKTTEVKRYDWVNGEWVDDYTTTFYWSERNFLVRN